MDALLEKQDLQFTFGIVTSGDNPESVLSVVDSIIQQKIPYGLAQIIIVGGQHHMGFNGSGNCRTIKFDESIKPGWITRKKNIITQEAIADNIVYMHDYIRLMPGWYDSFVKFNEVHRDWDVCMNAILNKDGTRYRDWVEWTPKWVPYDDWGRTQRMYVSGAYWVAKRDFMKRFPLDERRVWGYGEDVEWSIRARPHWRYVCNPDSKVQLMKQKETSVPESISNGLTKEG